MVEGNPGVSMHKIMFRIAARGLESRFHPEVAQLELPRDLTVTDRVEVARACCEPVVFVATNLPDIMQVVCQSSRHSVLYPGDVIPERLRCIANGSQVFSGFNALDLKLDEETWRLIGFLAHGHTQGQACEKTGFSLRTAQRTLRVFMKKARVSDTFHWTLLKPIFPDVEEFRI